MGREVLLEVGRVFTEINKKFMGNHLCMSAYLTNIVKTYKNCFKLGSDVPWDQRNRITGVF